MILSPFPRRVEAAPKYQVIAYRELRWVAFTNSLLRGLGFGLGAMIMYIFYLLVLRRSKAPVGSNGAYDKVRALVRKPEGVDGDDGRDDQTKAVADVKRQVPPERRRHLSKGAFVRRACGVQQRPEPQDGDRAWPPASSLRSGGGFNDVARYRKRLRHACRSLFRALR
ncbi:hypothetical protein ON010_g15226 [Phytophthora cinnamomi]|nr:hypothetical protein ON010_g15226 [Phytophthora cinnamomi]